MDLWIPITVLSAFCQNLRSALQKRLTERLSAEAAAYVRFCYALPFAASFVLLLAFPGGQDIPAPNALWFGNVLAGGFFQALGTVALIRSFGHRNFAASTAYSKTETVQTAAFGFVFLGDAVSPLALGGILVSLAGVMLLSLGTAAGPRALVEAGLARGARGAGPSHERAARGAGPSHARALSRGARGAGPSHARALSRGARGAGPSQERGAWLGIAAGAGFAVSAVCYRAASLALPEGAFFVRAAVTLLGATALQTVGMGAYLLWREPGSLGRVARSWRAAVWVGLAGMLASAGWFSAMTLMAAAYVRALGQIELLFAFAAGVVLFRERVRIREVGGALLMVVGLVLLLW